MYDVIIVGAGTAGCVLAERLSRSGRHKVLLVEAGGAPTTRFVSIPAAFPKLFKSRFDWAFESEPQTAVGGRRVFTPRGKMLGGSSNMNAQVHQWCHPQDYQDWLTAGATGWAWTDVAPIFRAQENWLGEDPENLRGRYGPLRATPNRNARPLAMAFVEAARRAGLGEQRYYNGGAYLGAWISEIAHRDGKRFSTYQACLEPAMRRANLEILTDAQATHITFESGRATGVRLTREGEEITRLGRAIVLAAGAIGSPQLLTLSGIGPTARLAELGIPVRIDAPEVGANLQDHPLIPMVFRTRSTDTLKSAESPLNVLRYLLLKRGMLASNGIEAIAFAQIQPRPSVAPDLELIFTPMDFRDQFLEPPLEHAFGVGVAVVAPRSRGRVSVRSPDPFVSPAIDLGLLSDADGIDARVMLAGMRLTRKIAATAPLADGNAGEMRPGESAVTDAELMVYAGQTLQTVYHPTSTCRMGGDARAVTDPQLRVRGVDGLWVVDASVMPSAPRGHPNAVVAMIASRAADWIDAGLRA